MENGESDLQRRDDHDNEITKYEDMVNSQIVSISDEFRSLGDRTTLVHVGEYVRRHKAIEAAIKETKNQYKIILKQYKATLEALNRAVSHEIEDHVLTYTCAGRKRSIDTLHGRAGFRASQGRVRVIDEDAFIGWLHDQPDTIRERMTDCIQAKVVRTTSIRHYIEDTAEIPQGIAYTPPGDNFYPSMKKEDMNASESNDR